VRFWSVGPFDRTVRKNAWPADCESGGPVLALLSMGVEFDTEQTTLPRICCGLHSVMQCGDKMQDLEKMAATLLETARKLPPGAEQHALLEQIGTFRIKLSAVAAKRKELQSASQVGP
jgi:hypothetical protein